MIFNEKEPFYCIKLKTGETIFAEVLDIDTDLLVMANPFEIKHDPEQRSSIYGAAWIPYTDPNRIAIPSAQMYYIGKLNRNFKEFYGTILLQHKIHEIKKDVESKMEDENDYYTMIAGCEEIDKTAEVICAKFNINNEVDTSQFREIAEKMKPMIN